MKVVTVVGARPQFVKAAVVSRVLRGREGVTEILVHTGQHFDGNMSSVFFDEMAIPQPDVNLGVGGGTHGANTGRMLEGIEKVLLDARPDWVLVYGDTDSTLAGALAAAKLHIRVAHVEAGLRSFNRRMPEEINRVVTDHVSDLLFAPTDVAVRNLAAEGIAGEKVVRCGDVMFDAALFYGGRAAAADLPQEPFILATIHRPANTDDPVVLGRILGALGDAALPVVLPIHPRTRARLAAAGVPVPPNVRVRDPVGYLEMVALERAARVIVTDSGGVQKEAYFHRVPCVTVRDETEWTELLDAGVNMLVGSDPQRLRSLLTDRLPVFPADAPTDLYGDGRAGEHIVERLCAG